MGRGDGRAGPDGAGGLRAPPEAGGGDGLLDAKAPGARGLPRDAHPGPAPGGGFLIQPGDTLSGLAAPFQSTVAAILAANPGLGPERLWVGQPLWIPLGPLAEGPVLKLILDSELVYGPAYRDFRVAEVVRRFGGYLSRYQETVGGRTLDAAQILEEVARNHSVGPRVLAERMGPGRAPR